MSHWSQTAQQSANQTMSVSATDAAVRECIDRSWEPLAEINVLPHWQTTLRVLDEPQPLPKADGNSS